MTATNININDFIHVLSKIRDSGTNMINLDMIQDADEPTMNKLIIHPVKPIRSSNNNNNNEHDMPPMHDPMKQAKNKKNKIRNPNINKENNDIFNSFNEYL